MADSETDEGGKLVSLLLEWDWESVVCRLQTPEGAAEACETSDGDLPLHVALQCVAPWAVVNGLLEVYPRAAATKDHDNQLPLAHVCCHEYSSLEVVRAIVDAFPEAIKTFDDLGNAPLHHTPNQDVMRVIIEKDPSAAGLVSKCNGRFPLHCLLEDREPELETVQMLADACPEALWTPDLDGNLPLHLKCYFCLPETPASVLTLRELLKRYPNAAKVPNGDPCRHLPLHAACQWCRLSASSVQDLIAAFPEATAMADLEGNIPAKLAYARYEENTFDSILYNDQSEEWIHQRASKYRFASRKVATAVLRAYPPALYIPDAEGRSIADMVVTGDLSLSVSDILHDAYPDGVGDSLEVSTAVTEQHSVPTLPLHLACNQGAPTSFVVEIIQLWPQTLRTVDNLGRMPLHVACCRGVILDFDVFCCILFAYSGALTVKDCAGYTPLALACVHDASLSVLYTLLVEYPDTLKMDCSPATT